MAASKLTMPHIKTTRSLGYIKVITKIPEPRKVELTEHYMLPCASDHSLFVVYDNPFDIVSVIYGVKDLHQKVLTHIKQNHKYYTEVGNSYLNLKKLDLLNWIVSMMSRNLPADELCLHAISTYFNLHIILDYHGGFWFKLNMDFSDATTTENDNTDSDSTEPYDIYENIIGTIYCYTLLPSAKSSGPQSTASQKTKDSVRLVTHLPFKYPMRKCGTRAKKQKEISDHYRQSHNKSEMCKFCRRKYSTPHSLAQYLYKHKKIKKPVCL